MTYILYIVHVYSVSVDSINVLYIAHEEMLFEFFITLQHWLQLYIV